MSAEAVIAEMIGFSVAVNSGKDVELPDYLKTKGELTEEEQVKLADVACRADLQCWGERYLTRAEINCAPAIAELALYAYEWTDGFRYRKFDKWAWLDREAGTLGYNGRMIKMLDANGYWHPMSYWCQYNPATGEASAEVYN